MPTVKGNLLFVSSRAAHVSEVWVRAPRVRTHAEGLVTTGNDHFPVIDGQVEFTAVPGPAVLALISQGRAVDTVPIVVGESESQTLRQVVNAAEIADDATKREIEKLAAQAVHLVDSSTENARKAQDGAQRAETAAGEAKKSEQNAISSASSANKSSVWVSEAEDRTQKYASAAAQSASEAKGSATSAKQDADRAANIANSTSWDGDRLAVNGKTSPSLTGPKGEDGAKTWDEVQDKPVAVEGSGHLPVATGPASTALGRGVKATGAYSTALGMGVNVSGLNSSALGAKAYAAEDYSTALGSNARAEGLNSTALGMGANAVGESSVALGLGTYAEGVNSTAIGYGASTSEDNTIVIGSDGQTVIIAGRNLLTEIDALKARIEELENK